MKFGCHISIKNGYFAAAKEAEKIQAKAFQYFPKNPRSLKIKSYDEEDAKRCRNFCYEKNLISVSHSPYPTDLAPEKSMQKAVVGSLLNDLEISEACGSVGVVVHFAKLHQGRDPLDTYKMMLDTLNQVLVNWDGACLLLLENNAAGSYGTTIEELVKIRELCDKPASIGFCLDTCHAFASGLWTGDNWPKLAKKATDLGFFEALKVIHFNNSKYEMGSGKDRHANIFHQGQIPLDDFDKLLSSKKMKDLPFILETPKDNISHQAELVEIYNRWGKA